MPRLEFVAITLFALSCCCFTLGCKMVADGQNVEGVRLLEQGQPQAALQRFQHIMVANPTNADAVYNMAATYHRMGSEQGDKKLLDQAESLYNRCLDLNPDHLQCRRGLAVLLVETDRSENAFNLLKNWASSAPQNADARIELARLYEEMGDLETAKLHLNKAILIDQNNSRAWAALAKLREDLGDPEQALANYQRSYNLNQFQPGVANRIAALSRARLNGGSVSTPSGTRTVTVPPPTRR